jgi:hypothetical protein
MKEAIDLRDTGGRDPARYAAPSSGGLVPPRLNESQSFQFCVGRAIFQVRRTSSVERVEKRSHELKSFCKFTRGLAAG